MHNKPLQFDYTKLFLAMSHLHVTIKPVIRLLASAVVFTLITTIATTSYMSVHAYIIGIQVHAIAIQQIKLFFSTCH